MAIAPKQSPEEKLARLEVLLEVSNLLTSTPDPAKALKALLRKVVRITRATSGSIAMLDAERGVLDILAAINIPPRTWKTLKLQLGVGITGWVAYTGKPLRANDVRRNSHYVQVKPDIRSELAVPMLIEGRVIGVINVDSVTRGAFSSVDEDLLAAVANHSARIVETARLHEAARRHARELESLFAFGQRLIRQLPGIELLDEVVRQGKRLAQADLCLLALYPPGDPHLTLRAGAGQPPDWPANLHLEAEGGLLREVVESGAPRRCDDLEQEAQPEVRAMLLAMAMHSMVAVPVRYQDRSLGALAVYFDHPRRAEERELRLLELLAGHFAVALQNNRRYNRILAMEEELRRTERFTLLGGLAAEIAHEIRNPITIINMLVHSLAEQIEDPTLRRDLETVMEKLERIEHTVEQTLDLARSSEIHLEPLSMNDLLTDLLTFLRYKIDQSGVRLVERLDPDLPLVAADRGQIQQVFLNLLMNALQATAPGGTLTVRSTVRDDEALGRVLSVSVTDSGVGIPDSERPRVFDPFFTTRPGGTGLGLFIARKIVSNHGGAIALRSTPGKGSKFIVRLPLPKAESP